VGHFRQWQSSTFARRVRSASSVFNCIGVITPFLPRIDVAEFNEAFNAVRREGLRVAYTKSTFLRPFSAAWKTNHQLLSTLLPDVFLQEPCRPFLMCRLFGNSVSHLSQRSLMSVGNNHFILWKHRCRKARKSERPQNGGHKWVSTFVAH